jgi:hypothetical protein
MKAEKSITVTAHPQNESQNEVRICLAQIASRGQRCVGFAPGILDADAFARREPFAGQISIIVLRT